jgi:3-oxoacyl-[acyl-carrier-protein] synthase II
VSGAADRLGSASAGVEVVITGLGAMSCLGSGVGALWAGLLAGRSALALDEEMAGLGLRCRVSGRVPGVEDAFAACAGGLSRDERAHFSRYSQLGFTAAFEALRGAGLVTEDLALRIDPGRAGVAIGTGIGPISELCDAFSRAFARGRPADPGRAVPRILPSFLPGFLGDKLGADRGRNAISLACNSGLVALEEAFDAVRRGRARWFLAGGVEEDSPWTWWAFDGMRALAKTPASCPEPARESCPFSALAHGIVPSGAAAFVVVEALDHALARGAPVRARLSACRHEGASGRAPFTAFEVEGYRRVARAALADAGVMPAEIDLCTAHTHSTGADVEELWALDPLLDLAGRPIPVTTPKSLVGHSMGASGVLDVISLVLQIEAQRTLANHHIEPLSKRAAPFAACLEQAAAPRVLRHAMKIGYATGGSYAAVVLSRV